MIHQSPYQGQSKGGNQAKLQTIISQFHLKLHGHCEALLNEWIQLKQEGYPKDKFKHVIRNTHSLAGSTGSYGFPALSSVLLDTETTLKSIKSPSDNQRIKAVDSALSQLVAEAELITTKMREKENLFEVDFDFTESQENNYEIAQHEDIEIYVADDDPTQAELIKLQLESLGYQCKAYTSLEELREAVLISQPNLIICDIVFPEGEYAGIEEIRSLKRAQGKNIPVIFISAQTGTKTRLAALRSGGDGFFSKPLSMPKLIAKIDQLAMSQDEKAYRALILDDDPDCASLHRFLLEEEGFEVKVITDPMDLIDVALDFSPEIFLIDFRLPGTDGIELTDMLRQEEAFLSTPIFFITGEQQDAMHHKALLSGANEIFTKPVDQEELLVAVEVQTKAYRNQNVHQAYFGMLDPVTGLHNEHYFTNELELACKNKIKSKHDKKTAENTSLQYLIEIEVTNFQTVFPSLEDKQCALVASQFAARLKQNLDKKDIAASFHLHTFYVLKEVSKQDNIKTYLKELVDSLNQAEYFVSGRPLKLTACAAAAPIAKSSRKTIQTVDAQCRRLMELEPSGYYVQQANEKPTNEQLNKYWLNQLRTAIQEKKLLLNYQPIFNLQNDGLDRYETLIRMKDSSGKTIAPAEFYATATRYELDKYIDRWVIANCIEQIKSDRDQDHVFFVKIARNSVHSEKFVQWLTGMLRSSDIPPQRLVFEFFEDDIDEDMMPFKELIHAIRKLNHRVTLEHFGKNGSSTSILDNITFDYVKFDQLITHNIAQSEKQKELLKHLSKGFEQRNIEMIASYVESPESLTYLAAQGINLIQGNLLQEPMQQPSYDDIVMGEMSLPRSY